MSLSIGIGIGIERYQNRGGSQPVNVTAPILSGLTLVGETLTSTTGTWSGTPPISYGYTFLSTTDVINFTSLQSGSSPNYVVQAADSGKFIRCSVLATNAFGVIGEGSNYLAISNGDQANLQSYDAAKFTLVGSKISVWADQDPTKSTWGQGTDSRRPTLTSGVPIFPSSASGGFMQRTDGELELANFSCYMVVRGTTIPADAGFFSASSRLDWLSLTNIWQAATERSAFRLGHTGNRVVVLVWKKNGNSIECWYNNRKVLSSTSFSGQSVRFRNFMGLSMSASYSVAGPCQSVIISSDFHTDSQTNDLVNSLYEKYNLAGNTATDCLLGYGDSNTAGFGSTGPWLPAVGTALGLNYTNLGISGSAMQDTVGTASTSGYRRQNQIISKSGQDWLVIALGTNDIQLSGSIDTYEEQYSEVLTNLIAAGYNPNRIVLNSPMYRMGNDKATELSAYRDVVLALSVEFGTRYFDLLQDFRDNGGDANMADTLHANATGRVRWQNGLIATITA